MQELNKSKHLWDEIKKDMPPQELQQFQQTRDKSLGNSFENATIDEWKEKEQEYQAQGRSHCNTAIGEILKDKGIDLPFNTPMNDIIKYMQNSPEWEKMPRGEDGYLDHQEANEAAKKGNAVVVTQNNPDGHGHGAVLTGNPTMFTSKHWKDEQKKDILIPEVQGSVGSGKIETKHLGYHLKKTEEPQMEYYRYKGF